MAELHRSRRREIGVWIELPKGARWANEGMARLIGFMIEGVARQGGPRFHLMVGRGVDEPIRQDLRSLNAKEDVDWQVHAPTSTQEMKLRIPGGGMSAPSTSPYVAKLRRLPPREAGERLAREGAAALPLFEARAMAMGKKFDREARLSFLSDLRNDPLPHLMALSRLYGGLPGKAARQRSQAFAQWALDVSATPDADFDSIEAMASYANAYVPVEGWIVLHPFFRGAELLTRPRAVIFPDAIPLVFPTTDPAHWTVEGPGSQWRANARQALSKAPAVITFSKHVASRDLKKVVGVKDDKVSVIPHAPPSVAEHLSFLDPNKPKGNHSTRRHAGDLLRSWTVSAGTPYIVSFPFEDAKYFVVSTQDRATKNIGLAAEAAYKLIREAHFDVKMITTAEIHWGQTWTRLPGLIERRQLHLDVVSMHDLPRSAHAALYHCAQLAVHPAFFEGGHGPFPFYEALSVGCPCIMGRGPHTEELVEREPELGRYLFEPYDADELASLISATIKDREAVVDHQLSILARLRERTWADVARAYGEAATHSHFQDECG
jgi:glycosyltransferase involved in cell wall biosynthesis